MRTFPPFAAVARTTVAAPESIAEEGEIRLSYSKMREGPDERAEDHRGQNDLPRYFVPVFARA